jgi:large subunit ribosomal protein L15
MKLNELTHNEGAKKSRMRVGRGIGSGKGKTCGVGQKGQKSRSGVAINGFEGGQMPLYQRLPKFGFNNKRFGTHYVEITFTRLQEAIDTKKIDAKKDIDEAALIASGVVRRARDGIKLLNTGDLKAKVTLKIAAATKGAIATVEKAGGSVEIIKTEIAPVKKRGEGKTQTDTKGNRLKKKMDAKKAAMS